MSPTIVRGHVTTWKITPTEDGRYEVTPGGKSYKDMKTAKWAIRTAEERYIKDHPNTPVANRDVWFDHGTLIVDDWDGNYYDESVPVTGEEVVTESNTTGQYVWCEYRYVSNHSAEELMKFAQMLYSTKYYTRVKVTGINKEGYESSEGHQVYKMDAEGLHEDFDSFYFLVQCTEEEAEMLPSSSVTEAKDDDNMHPHGYDDVIKLIKNGKLWNHREIELDTGDCDKLEDYLRKNGHEVNYNEEDDEYYANVGQLGRISFSDRHLYTESEEPLTYVGCHATYDVTKFNWTPERCWLDVFDNDEDKDIEIEICKGIQDEDSGRIVAYDVLQDEEFNVPKEVRNELISTFGLDDFGLTIEESVKDYKFNVSCNDGPTKVVKLVWDANDPEGAKETAKKYYSQEHTTNADDRENKWTIEESEDLYRHKTNQHTGSWDSDPDDTTLNQPDNEEYGMTITIGSGVNADGCSIKVLDKNGNTVHDEEYRYGYNASYSRKWASFYPDKPFIGDIVNDLCKKYSINREDIDYRKGKNLFKNTDATDDQVSGFIKMLDESKEIETDADELANNVEVTSEPQDEETLADKVESEVHQPDLFVGKKCIFTYKGLIDDLSCYAFDDNEQNLKDASGKEVEVISGCNEYGYAIKVDGKELYGVSGEELVIHDTSDRAEEVETPSDK